MRSVEGLLESLNSVRSGDEGMEERDDRSFIFSSDFSGVGDGGESFPHNIFTTVDGDEKRNTRITNTVTVTDELVQKKNDDTREGELEDNKDSVTGTQFV